MPELPTLLARYFQRSAIGYSRFTADDAAAVVNAAQEVFDRIEALENRLCDLEQAQAEEPKPTPSRRRKA